MKQITLATASDSDTCSEHDAVRGDVSAGRALSVEGLQAKHHRQDRDCEAAETRQKATVPIRHRPVIERKRVGLGRRDH